MTTNMVDMLDEGAIPSSSTINTWSSIVRERQSVFDGADIGFDRCWEICKRL